MAGTAWLLQFIEDLQQSREFHKTCEVMLPNEAAKIPEVLLSYRHSIVTLPAAANTTSQHNEMILCSTNESFP